MSFFEANRFKVLDLVDIVLIKLLYERHGPINNINEEIAKRYEVISSAECFTDEGVPTGKDHVTLEAIAPLLWDMFALLVQVHRTESKVYQSYSVQINVGVWLG